MSGFNPPNDPADQPQPGDPPVNAESMLDVLSESIADAKGKADAAREMIAMYAIRAVLDGGNISKIAQQCGFGQGQQAPTDAPGQADISDFMRQIGLPPEYMKAFGINQHSGSSICEFVHDQFEKQGSR